MSHMFGLGQQPQQTSGMNLSVTGAPTVMQQGVYQQPQQQFLGGVMGGMPQQQQQQFAQAQQFVQQPVAPPSEMELMSMLLESQNPVHRFIATGGLASIIDLVATATSLSLINILKDATFVIDEDEGAMKMDMTSMPENLKTLSVENVGMALNQIVNNSQQTIQQAEARKQQILATSQQNMMSGALQAALADENMMEKVGGGVGSFARNFMKLP